MPPSHAHLKPHMRSAPQRWSQPKRGAFRYTNCIIVASKARSKIPPALLRSSLRLEGSVAIPNRKKVAARANFLFLGPQGQLRGGALWESARFGAIGQAHCGAAEVAEMGQGGVTACSVIALWDTGADAAPWIARGRHRGSALPRAQRHSAMGHGCGTGAEKLEK